jgi:hypothetical protein
MSEAHDDAHLARDATDKARAFAHSYRSPVSMTSPYGRTALR